MHWATFSTRGRSDIHFIRGCESAWPPKTHTHHPHMPLPHWDSASVSLQGRLNRSCVPRCSGGVKLGHLGREGADTSRGRSRRNDRKTKEPDARSVEKRWKTRLPVLHPCSSHRLYTNDLDFRRGLLWRNASLTAGVHFTGTLKYIRQSVSSLSYRANRSEQHATSTCTLQFIFNKNVIIIPGGVPQKKYY